MFLTIFMSNPDKSLAEVKKMVEKWQDTLKRFLPHGRWFDLPDDQHWICAKLADDFPLLAQTLLNLMEDNEKMKKALWGASVDGGMTCEKCQKNAEETLSSLHYND